VTIAIPDSADLDALALARRSGWPEDLRVLVARYPREQWDTHPNLGEMARFWLSRHVMFRELSSAIEQIAALFRAGRLPPEEFARQFVPRLQFMLDQLNVHHQIEDIHYFPIFPQPTIGLHGGSMCWRATTTTFMAIWRLPPKPRTRCYDPCRGAATRCAGAATTMPMRAALC
jgi:hypothetical protein